MPWDTEAYDAYTIIQDSLGFAGIYRLIGINSFQFLRNFWHQNAFEQAEMILLAALDPTVASRARRGEFVTCFDHFGFRQTAIN